MVRETVRRVRHQIRGLQTAAYLRIAAPVEGLHQAAYLLAGLTLASQLLALLRDRTFAHTFGAGQVLDLYYAAFRVPDLVFAVVSSLVSAYVLIPRISALSQEETRDLLSQAVAFLSLAGGAISVVLAVFMPQFLTALYPDLMATSMHTEFVLLGRLLLLQPMLLGLSSVVSSVTQVHRRFFLFALAPVLYNVGIIVGTVYLFPHWGLVGIGAGVIIGSIAYLAINLPVLLETGTLPRVVWPRAAHIVPLMRDSIPRSLALGMGSIIALVLTSLASRMTTGAVSIFTFASNLEAVPLALIGSSYAVAAFPALSAAAKPEQQGEFTRILSASARHIIVWSLVALGLIIVLRAHLVRVILGSGAFDWNATRLTAAALAVLSVGLAADALKLLFSRALYAARQSWRPLMYQVAAGAVTIGCAVVFLSLPESTVLEPLARALRVADVADTSILLLALAASLGQLFLVALSLLALRSVAPGLARTLLAPCRDGFLAALVGGSVAYATLAALGTLAPLTTLLTVFLDGLAAGLVGLAGAGLTLHLIKNPEFGMVADVALRFLRAPQRVSEVLAPSADEPAQP